MTLYVADFEGVEGCNIDGLMGDQSSCGKHTISKHRPHLDLLLKAIDLTSCGSNVWNKYDKVKRKKLRAITRECLLCIVFTFFPF